MIHSATLQKFDLTGKTAVVTGGGTGLGYAMARALLLLGAKVLIAARREDVLQKATQTLREETGSDLILHTTVDLLDRDDVARFADTAAAMLGGVDIFIGNAAYSLFLPIEQIGFQQLDECVRVNFIANFELMRHFLPAMRRKRWGRVLFSSSVGSVLSGSEGMSVYSATKSALNSLVRTAAVEVSADGVNVNSLVIGCYMTDMTANYQAGLSEEQSSAAAAHLEKMERNTTIGRLGYPRELEGMVQLLTTDAGSYITGQCHTVDGGMTAMIWRNEAVPPERRVTPAYCAGD